MSKKPIAAKTSSLITGTAGAVVALMLVTACASIPPMSTQESQQAQLKAAEQMSLPIEKTLPKSGIVLRLIPAGTFTMGSPKSEQDAVVESRPAVNRADTRKFVEGETQHRVTLTKTFYIGKFEVTQGQWTKVMGNNPSKFKDAGDDAPVEQVSWHDCTNFMAKLAALEGMPEGSCRLPTESQWEYACRAGTKTAFCYGDDLDSSMANFDGYYPLGKGEKGEFRKKTVAVGMFKPNAWGLYDMHGNVWEWCTDWYGEYTGDATDPSGAATGSYRVIRGGCWILDANCCRSAYRGTSTPGYANNYVGFRPAVPAGQ